GQPFTAQVSYAAGGRMVVVDGIAPALDARVVATADGVYIVHKGRQTFVQRVDLLARNPDQTAGDGLIRAPMHGKVLAFVVRIGETVIKGQRLAVIEAMKMEHTLTAPCAGTVSEIVAATGGQIAEGAKLLTILAEPARDNSKAK